jgi:hypothetical protein
VAPEIRLEIGLVGSLFIPTSVLMFGFTSKASIHWIVPVIGAALYLPGIFLNFQSILMYITMAYPAHSASVLAGNDLFRSAMASVFPYVNPVRLLLMTVTDFVGFQTVWPRILHKPWTWSWFCSASWYLILTNGCILRKYDYLSFFFFADNSVR